MTGILRSWLGRWSRRPPTVHSPEEPSAPPRPAPLSSGAAPPADRFCDLVLTGGVASGVAYPWAIVELARHYRFRRLGGTSVGGVAAALAAASEYGRCMNVPHPFEVLRRVPLELAGPPDAPRQMSGDTSSPAPRTKMLSLFLPLAPGRRLFELMVELMTQLSLAGGGETPAGGSGQPGAVAWRPLLYRAFRLYGSAAWQATPSCRIAAALAALLAMATLGFMAWPGADIALPTGMRHNALPVALFLGGQALLLLALVLWLRGCWWQLRRDLIDGLVRNGFGFCSGMSGKDDPHEGFTEWMHTGIQKAAGLAVGDSAPLTFRDLWNAPRPRGIVATGADRSLVANRGIDLEIVVANVTHGRPYRFPLHDQSARLFYRRAEWENLFPASVLDWLDQHSRPYAPASASDPPAGVGSGADGLRELPTADLPVVVAARMSMSFPLLFSTVPVYAIDHEARRGERRLRRCRLADGGLCSNFPIHLFDSAWPKWPLFGFWLSQRLRSFAGDPVWLPHRHDQGAGDNWIRYEPSTDADNHRPDPARDEPHTLAHLGGYLTGLVLTMKDWNDRSTMRLPHVRNRVVRLALQPHEGQLHIAMPGPTILKMAHDYGTRAGQVAAQRFRADDGGSPPAAAWRQHLYVRTHVLLRAMHRLLHGLGAAVEESRHSLSIREVLAQAATQSPLLQSGATAHAAGEEPLTNEQSMALIGCIDDLDRIEKRLADVLGNVAFEPLPIAELQTRAPH